MLEGRTANLLGDSAPESGTVREISRAKPCCGDQTSSKHEMVGWFYRFISSLTTAGMGMGMEKRKPRTNRNPKFLNTSQIQLT